MTNAAVPSPANAQRRPPPRGMRRRTQRLWLVVGGLVCLGGAAALALGAMSDNLVFFYSPTDLAAKPPPAGRMVRIGGLVEAGSVARAPDGRSVVFTVTDTNTRLLVRYQGVLPDLFREGQGVVAQGRVTPDGFKAEEVLARHDETYMPPEVAKALKDQGHWKGEATAKAPGPAPAPALAPAPAPAPGP